MNILENTTSSEGWMDGDMKPQTHIVHREGRPKKEMVRGDTVRDGGVGPFKLNKLRSFSYWLLTFLRFLHAIFRIFATNSASAPKLFA